MLLVFYNATTQIHFCIKNFYAKTNLNEEAVFKKFLVVLVPHRNAMHHLVNKFRRTGSALDKSMQ